MNKLKALFLSALLIVGFGFYKACPCNPCSCTACDCSK